MSATFQLPSTFTVGGVATQPLVSIAEIRAHVVLLGLFFKLRQAVESEGKDWVSFVRGAVDRFGEWAQQVDRDSCKTPELDVAMVWHTYMLNPLTFAKDASRVPCLQKLDGFPTIDLAKTLSVNSVTTEVTAAASSALAFGLDLTAAVLRQGGFIEKVDGFGWTADGFFDAVETANGLVSAIARYHAFLDLLSVDHQVRGVPTMDIDLAWHTHQLMGKTYRSDTMRLVGHAVNHNDDVEEFGGEQVLEDGFDATAAAWKARFGVAYDSNSKTAGDDCNVCEVHSPTLLEENALSKAAGGKCMRCDAHSPTLLEDNVLSKAAGGKCMRCDARLAAGAALVAVAA